MKNTLLFLKLGLVSLLLVASLACGSAQSKNGGNSSNVAADNVNSSAANNAVAAETKPNKRDPKRFCHILSDFVNSGDYKVEIVSHECGGVKTLNLSTDRTAKLLYTAEGDAENVKLLKLTVLNDGKLKDAAEADEELAKSAETLWFAVFTEVLPKEILDEILSNKGKAVEKVKNFTATNNATVLRHKTGGSEYGLVFSFELPK